jgi:hypothetical protein
MTPRHPEINVPLVGEDGNAFAILGRCSQAMKRAGVSSEERTEFMTQAQSGDYDNLLRTVVEWFDTSSPYDDDEEDW